MGRCYPYTYKKRLRGLGLEVGKQVPPYNTKLILNLYFIEKSTFMVHVYHKVCGKVTGGRYLVVGR